MYEFESANLLYGQFFKGFDDESKRIDVRILAQALIRDFSLSKSIKMSLNFVFHALQAYLN